MDHVTTPSAPQSRRYNRIASSSLARSPAAITPATLRIRPGSTPRISEVSATDVADSPLPSVSDRRIAYRVGLEHNHGATREFNRHSCSTLDEAHAIHPLNIDEFRLVESTSPIVLGQRLQPRIETRIFVSFASRSFRERISRKVGLAGGNGRRGHGRSMHPSCWLA